MQLITFLFRLELDFIQFEIIFSLLQKIALCLINFSNLKENALPHFMKARSLPLNFIYFERMCHMMHDIYNKTAPNNLNLFITKK